MKTPWLTFAGMCAVVLGIVIFCVIMGSYTSLLRAKNRIHAAKDLMITDCRTLLAQAMNLVAEHAEQTAKVNHSKPARDVDTLVARLNTVLDDLAAAEPAPLPATVSAFESGISHVMHQLADPCPPNGPASPGCDQLGSLSEQTRFSIMRYNKQVDYFSTRKTVFPGFFTATWFHLDTLTFPQIDPDIATLHPAGAP